jgi:hypothetical protein
MITLLSISFVESQTSDDTVSDVPINMFDTGVIPMNGNLLGVLGEGDGKILNLRQEVDCKFSTEGFS